MQEAKEKVKQSISIQMSKQCNSCGCELHEFSESKGHKGQCRHCYAEYGRRRHSRPEYKKHQSARAKVNLLQKAGIIVKEPCSLCGCKQAEKHHPDYNNPTDITWLCKSCHSEFHVLENKVLKLA